MKQIRKRLTALLVVLVLAVSVFTGNTGISVLDHAVVSEVNAASGNVTLSRLLTRCGISCIGRAAAEGLWCIRVGGKKTFCLNSGKTMNSGDHASGKTHDAATYGNQSLAKVLTYYFGEKGQKGGTKTFLLCQAYVWACGKGANKKTAMIQAGKNIGVSGAEAAKVFAEIQNTDPYGRITYYTISRCARGKNGASHQHLLSWSGSRPQVSYGHCQEPYTASADEKITVNVVKKDAKTNASLAGAEFELYRDGKKVATVTTGADGMASYIYTAEYQVTVPASSAYIWVKNWNSLSASQQKEEKKKGYYSSEALAAAACISDLKPKAAAMLEALKRESHIWKAVEVKAPENHAVSGQEAQTKTEGAVTKYLSFGFTDMPAEMTLKLYKKSSGDSGAESTLKGAVYGLYAAENICGSDNKTVVHRKDALVITLTTDEKGYAEAENLFPGKYYLLELTAPMGFEKDTEKHSVNLSYIAGSSPERKVTVTEQPVRNKVCIYKTFDGEKVPTETVTEKQLRDTYTPGICEHHTEHDEACGYAEREEAKPCTYFCDICAWEEVTLKKALPITDTFALVNARGETVSTFTIGQDGYGESELLPYGTYVLKQTEGTAGYDQVPDRTVTIQDSVQKITLSLDDPAKAPRIYLTKYQTVEDEETDTFLKEGEAGAEFALYGPDGELVTTAKTDAQGIAYFGELESVGTYRIHQLNGASGYQQMEDKTVEITEKKTYYVTGEDRYCGDKIRIRKYRQKTDKVPEKGAEFVILDASLAGKTKEELAAMDSAEERMDYVFGLRQKKNAIIGELCTDSQGQDAMLLTGWNSAEHPKGFVVFQTFGAEGYALSQPVYSSEMKPKTEDGVQVYEIEATDVWEDWADISLIKYMTSSETAAVPEVGARFRVVDETEQTVGEKETEEDGTLVFKELALGTYRIEQLSGDAAHEWMEPVYVTLTEKDRHKEIRISEKPIVDREKEILFTLRKTSEETGILLDGAQYELYRVSADQQEGQKETMTLVTVLCTGRLGEDETADPSGCASCTLPFGTYVLKEIYPADGYLLDPQEYRFTLDLDSVTYDETGAGIYEMELTDKPAMGKISLEKKGNVLAGYAGESQSFVSQTGTLAGAVYGLYAGEDIRRDDGRVIYAADTLIDKKTTDSAGQIKFTRTDENGQKTDRFYLGNYYIREISAPEGYVTEEEKYQVCLTWDNKTDQFDDVKKVENTSEKEQPVGNNSPDPDAGKYVLDTGEALNRIFCETAATSVTFTWEKAPQGAALTNVSSDKSGGIVLWKEGTDCYISTQLAGQVMYFNAVSAGMFANCTSLTDIRFANTDTSRAVDFSRMFYRCTALEYLDLSGFQMKNAENVSRMFAYCSRLKTICVNDQVLTREELYEEDIPSRITAEPKNKVRVGHTFTVDDFNFTMFYENGKSEEIYPTQTEAQINPQTAGKAGEITVQISFSSTGRYAEFGTIETQVNVLDPQTVPVERSYHEPEVCLQLHDAEQSITIQVVKTAAGGENREMLEGAEFTLYAGCDIVDAKGQLLFQKDEAIATQISGNDNFSYVEFSHLPSEIYKKDRTQPYMYYIRETRAPEGYYGNDKILYISGKTDDNTKAEFIYGYRGTEIQDSESNFTGSEDFLYENARIPYVTLKKEWSGDNADLRPEHIGVTVTLTDGTVKKYTLRAAEGWRLITDIDAGLISGCSVAQLQEMFRENLPDGYTEKGSSWNGETNTYTFRNVPDQTIRMTIEKVWEDRYDSDGIRPDSVEMGLYANEKLVKTISLPTAKGEWVYTEDDLPATDESEAVVLYTWKEMSGSESQNDAAQGYVALTETDPEDPSRTVITNFHEVKTVEKSVQKLWNDSDDGQKIRPEHIRVQLLADSKPVKVKKTEEGYVCDALAEEDSADTLVLNEENGWKATVTELPAYDGDREVVYTWREVQDKELWITGEPLLGYSPAYSTDAEDQDKTTITNTHTFFAGASVKVNKKIRKENAGFAVDEPEFTFTLSGTDVYGNVQKFTQKVTFTEKDFQDADQDEYVTKSVEFVHIPFGTYTLTESGMEGIYVRKTWESQSLGAVKDGDGFTIVVGPTVEEGKAMTDEKTDGLWDQEVTFENEAVRGSVTLTKYKEDKRTVLPGVTFTLKNEDESVLLTAATDEKGRVTFEDLLPGTYTLTEIKTETGSTLLAEPIQVQIPLKKSEEEVREQKLDVSRAVKYEDYWYMYHLTYDITNHASLVLPMTGFFDSWKSFMPLTAAMALLLAGLWLWFGRKLPEKKKEKPEGETDEERQDTD